MSDLALRARRAVDEAETTVFTLDRVNALIALVCGSCLGALCAVFI